MSDKHNASDEISEFDKRLKRFRLVYVTAAMFWICMVVGYLFIPSDHLVGALARLIFILGSVILWALISFHFTRNYILGDADDEWSQGKAAQSDRIALRIVVGFLTTLFVVATFWDLSSLFLNRESISFSIDIQNINHVILPAWIGMSILPGLCLISIIQPLSGNRRGPMIEIVRE